MRTRTMRAVGGLAAAGTLIMLGPAEAGAATQASAAPGSAWGKAIEVPGTFSLNVGGNSSMVSVSYTQSGYCAVAGNYGASDGDSVITRVATALADSPLCASSTP